MFKGMQFLSDYDIDYKETGEDIGANWVGIKCPRCQDHAHHLGYNENTNAFTCWRCGKMKTIEAVQLLANVSKHQAIEIIKDYGGFKKDVRYERKEKEKDINVKFPKGILKDFPERHRKYLEKRNFDPDYLIDTWNLKATGHLGAYKFRIIAPIYLNERLISYQGRDITDKSSQRYKACSKDNERIHHKNTLYGIDSAKSSTVLVVEGITDVWRMRFGSIATFGTKFTGEQVNLLNKRFKRIFVWFDETDEEANKNAQELVFRLSIQGNEVYQIELGINKDPAELSDEEANYIMRDLLIR